MIIRLKKANRPEIMEFMVDPEDVDYWIESQNKRLCVEICGKVYVVKRGKEKILLAGMEMIHEAIQKHKDFIDLSEL